MRIRTEEGMPCTRAGVPFAEQWIGAALRMAADPADPTRMLFREAQPVETRQPAPVPVVVGEADRVVRTYAATMANDQPYRYVGLGRDDEGYLSFRWFEARLTMRADHFASRLGQPEGMPLAWQHGVGWEWDPSPVGHVLAARVEGNEMVGEVEVSEAALLRFIPGGLADLEMGICKGLSIGFTLLEPPKVTRRDGTMAKPDQVRIGRVRLRELSLVPIPALAGCGLGDVVSEADTGSNAGTED